MPPVPLFEHLGGTCASIVSRGGNPIGSMCLEHQYRDRSSIAAVELTT